MFYGSEIFIYILSNEVSLPNTSLQLVRIQNITKTLGHIKKNYFEIFNSIQKLNLVGHVAELDNVLHIKE